MNLGELDGDLGEGSGVLSSGISNANNAGLDDLN